jgi:hypothetical protein
MVTFGMEHHMTAPISNPEAFVQDFLEAHDIIGYYSEHKMVCIYFLLLHKYEHENSRRSFHSIYSTRGPLTKTDEGCSGWNEANRSGRGIWFYAPVCAKVGKNIP